MRRLIVFSDPGGAKPCLSLAKKWSLKDKVIIVSDKKYSFYNDFNLPVILIKEKNAISIIKKHRPEFIYTGTSYTSLIEKRFISEAQSNGIYCESFVDHYTCIRERFELNKKLVIPNKVNVVDIKAKQIAVKIGIPSERIKISENPYHGYLTNWKPTIQKTEFIKKLKIAENINRIILFAPDPLTNREGKKKFGTDEFEILDLIVDTMDESQEKYFLIIKSHPNQNIISIKNKIEELKKRRKPFEINNILLINEPLKLNLNDVIYYSDFVVGIFSNILIEAKILKKPTLQVLVGLNKKWRIKLGNGIIAASNKNQLEKLICKSK